MEAAKRLGKPVKWAGDRTEHFLTDAQGRDNVVTAEMAMDEDGRFLGLRVNLIANLGAYISQYGPFIPYIGATMSTGVYDIQALDVTITGVYTNTCPVDAYRGAGRPEAAFLLEKLVDACARDLGLAPEEIRRRNFIRPEQFPYRTQTGPALRCGRVRRPHGPRPSSAPGGNRSTNGCSNPQRAGKIRGIGMATYIEACAFAGSEPAHLELNGDGTVTLFDRHAVERAGACDGLCPVRRRKAQSSTFRRIHVHQGDTDRLASGRRHRRLAVDPARRRFRGARRRGPGGEDQEDRRRRTGSVRRRYRTRRRHGAHRRHRPLDGLCRRSPRRRSSRRTSRASANSCRTKHLSERHPYLRGRDRSGDRRDRHRRLHDRRRFRRYGESDPAGRAGAWRRRAGHRPGVDRKHRLLRKTGSC